MIAVARRLRRDERGATIVEMGFVMAPLLIVVLVLFDFGHRFYIQSVVEGTLQQASRLATIGNKTPAEIDTFIQNKLAIFTKSTPPTITKKSYLQFSGVAKEEKFTDADGDNTYDAGECYVDENGNGSWDNASTAGRGGLGGADDIVFYTVTLTFPRIVPLGGFMGWAANDQVAANMVLRNQPYGAQATMPTCAA